MPRRKISISEAMQVLRENNLDVVVKPVEEELEQPVAQKKDARNVIRKVGNTAITITLQSQHMIGCGGFLTKTSVDEEAVIRGNIVKTYGPGQVTVPVTIASQLLHQDQLAIEADKRMLETTQRSYLIVQKRGYDGALKNVAVQVSDGALDSFNINSQATMIV